MHISLVQVPVKAKGKNNNNTVFPSKSERFTSFLSLEISLKLGALSPICKGFIIIYFFKRDANVDICGQ
jgi:hypothetical protein